MGGIIGGAVAGVAAGGMFASGMSTIQLEKQAALQTGKDTKYFASSVERDWRSATMRDTGATAEQVMAARVQAEQTGVDEVSARRMAERSVMLNRAMPAADMQEIMRAMLTMNKGFGTDSDTNADLIYRIASGAGDRANDLLDTFNEYSLLMKDAGISAEQFSAMLMAGAKSGAFNYDKLADGVKESIKARLTDGGELESLMGSGTKKGEIDTLVKDKSMREALKSAIGEFRQTNETGGDLAAPWMKVMTLVSSLYQKDPAAAKNIMERVGGTQFSEDLGASSVKTMVEALADPIKVLGDYQGKLADGVKDSFSAMERLSTSWESATDRFSQAVGDFAEAQSPFIELLAGGLDKGGQLIADNPGTALGVTAGALVLKQQAIRATYNSLKDRWFKGGGAGQEAAEALAKGAPEMGAPKSAPKGVPSWMDHRLSGSLAVTPPATSGGWLQSLKEGAGKTLGGKGGKMLGWLPALLFGGAQIYDAAQSGDNDQLITTTVGVGGSLAGGAAGAYGGATLGTAFFPGIGTAVGGVAGGILGSILGEEGV
ncbi:MAG: phage tail tape measure protein, partial [Aeromonas veronii]